MLLVLLVVLVPVMDIVDQVDDELTALDRIELGGEELGAGLSKLLEIPIFDDGPFPEVVD